MPHKDIEKHRGNFVEGIMDCYTCGHSVFNHEFELGECQVTTFDDCLELWVDCGCDEYYTGSLVMWGEDEQDCLSKDG